MSNIHTATWIAKVVSRNNVGSLAIPIPRDVVRHHGIRPKMMVRVVAEPFEEGYQSFKNSKMDDEKKEEVSEEDD